LCAGADVGAFHKDKRRDYFRCPTCGLVLVDPSQYLSAEQEKAEYDLHRNSPDDDGYRRFLSRLFTPMQARLATGGQGLDFGSGPGPTLSVMFEEAGYTMTNYDCFYARDAGVLDKQYDFITATEVLEHLHQPGKELERLWGILKPGGFLGIMTKLVLDREAFACWHYKNDATHVCFFSRSTFTWLAHHWEAEVEFIDNDVIIFHKR
jgi:SAM-dependent methyltransferase